MLRLLYLPMLCLCLSACIPELTDDNSEDDTGTVTNEEGEQLDAAIKRLNGLWDGQLDQAGTLRVLVYNGDVYGFDESTGLYGQAELDESGDSISMDLKRYTFSNTEADAQQYAASGVASVHTLSGLLFPTTVEDDTMVGDYESSSSNGSFVLSDDGTWGNDSQLSLLEGVWSATGYELYITQVDDRMAFREISSTVTGCTSSGYISLIDRNYNLYAVSVTERKNCNDFNVVDAEGYATLMSDDTLEFFLRKNTALLFSHYSRGTADGTSGSTDDSSDDSTDDTTDGSTDDTADDTTDDTTDETTDDTVDDTTDDTGDETTDDTGG